MVNQLSLVVSISLPRTLVRETESLARTLRKLLTWISASSNLRRELFFSLKLPIVFVRSVIIVPVAFLVADFSYQVFDISLLDKFTFALLYCVNLFW